MDSCLAPTDHYDLLNALNLVGVFRAFKCKKHLAMDQVECCVPPGFRFHPTEEELVGYYLTRKVSSQKIDLGVITDIDLYRIEPWDLQGW